MSASASAVTCVGAQHAARGGSAKRAVCFTGGAKVGGGDSVRMAVGNRRGGATTLAAVNLPEGVTVEKMGKDIFNTTYYPKGEDADHSRRPWVVSDAAGLRLGRLSTLVTTYLRGGNVGTYSPSMNMGTYVIIINSDKVVVSGKKFEDKLYRRHETGRPGSMKIERFKMLQARLPERIVERAVRGMLPKNRMGRELFTQLKVYKGGEHPHAAQGPTDVTAEVKANCYSSTMKK